jgi:EAL domain-containing protein (putative c-di-GMP-specific phosphodiesterase class I)
VCFEITETAAISQWSRALQFIATFKARGARFALDDFGSGMASVAYLRRLPVDFIKIDDGFVRELLHDPVDAAVVEAIAGLAHVTGIRVIAEFVENAAIRERLAALGVDYAQGYGIHVPAPLER